MYPLTSTSFVPDVLRHRLGCAGDLLTLPDQQQAESEPIREELVARIRAEIAQGTYETAEKLQIAFERMLEDVQD